MRDKAICFRTSEDLRKALEKLSVMDSRITSRPPASAVFRLSSTA